MFAMCWRNQFMVILFLCSVGRNDGKWFLAIEFIGRWFSFADHQFYHKWALLTDPDDFISGPKGYLKCDIGIIGKGDTVKVPQKSEKDPDDIEAYVVFSGRISV